MTQPVRVLVIDDDAMTRRLLQVALSADGVYQVMTASDAHEGIALFQRSPDFKFILSDLHMRGLSGIDLIRSIRTINHKVPIIVLSSMRTDQTLAMALEAGADDYLQKPVNLDELRRTVDSLIHLSRKNDRGNAGDSNAEGAAAKSNASSPQVRNIGDGTFVELTSATNPAHVERFQRFAERLVSTSLSEKERSDVRLALEEIVRNAMEWGNNFDRSKKLRLSYCLLPDRITFRIEDEGRGFDPNALKDPSLDPREHIKERKASGKRMGGWGVFLTRKIMDEVKYNSKGNVVLLTKFLHGAKQARANHVTRSLRKPTRTSRD